MNNEYEGFCTQCSVKIKSFEGLSSCPNCGTQSIPCHFKDQINLNINTHELHILVVWAERWIGEMKEKEQFNSAKTLKSILIRINEQLPDDQKIQMLCQEINDLKQEFGKDNIETNLLDIS